MSADRPLPKVTKAEYYSHLGSLCSRLCKAYGVKDSDEELQAFKAKRKEIRENKKKDDEDELNDLERLLLKLFKSTDSTYFEQSRCKMSQLSEFDFEGKVIRSNTLKIIERKIIQIENEELKLQKSKEEELKENCEEINVKYNEK